MSKLITSGKLAVILQVDQKSIANWARAGRIPFVWRGTWRRFHLPAVCAALGIDLEEVRPSTVTSLSPEAEPEPEAIPAAAPPLGGRTSRARTNFVHE